MGVYIITERQVLLGDSHTIARETAHLYSRLGHTSQAWPVGDGVCVRLGASVVQLIHVLVNISTLECLKCLKLGMDMHQSLLNI